MVWLTNPDTLKHPLSEVGCANTHAVEPVISSELAG
jgi:hypothetical protein